MADFEFDRGKIGCFVAYVLRDLWYDRVSFLH